MKFPDLVHLDDVTGALSQALQLFSHPSQNTLADLDAYRGLSQEELFPAPGRVRGVRVATRWRVPGLISEDIVFRSLHRPIEKRFRRRYRSEYQETHAVYARRIRPRSARQRPRLLYLHGYMQPETPLEELVVLAGMALRLDVEVIQLQPPYHGRRTPRGSRFGGEFYWTADLVRSFEALRQNLLDARSLLGWLLEQDPRPVGVLGLSLGGALALTLTCLEERLAFSVPLVAHMDLAALVADAPVLATMRRELRRFGWGIADLQAFFAQIGWNELRPKLPPERIQLFAASDDRFFDAAVVQELWRRWGQPAIHWVPSSHMGFITHLPEVVAKVRTFIDRWEGGALRPRSGTPTHSPRTPGSSPGSSGRRATPLGISARRR